jgi:hypothetical protein
MSATKTKATTVRVDRAALEQFMLEVEALATFDMLQAGGEHLCDTVLSEHVSGVVGKFAKATIGLPGDDDGERYCELASERGKALYGEIHKQMIDERLAA